MDVCSAQLPGAVRWISPPGTAAKLSRVVTEEVSMPHDTVVSSRARRTPKPRVFVRPVVKPVPPPRPEHRAVRGW
jgi:hypothetical protein